MASRMQEHNDENRKNRQQTTRKSAGAGTKRPSQGSGTRGGQKTVDSGQYGEAAPRKKKRPQEASKSGKKTAQKGKRPAQRPEGHGRAPKKQKRTRKMKKGWKIALFVVEILVLVLLVGAFWVFSKTNQMVHIDIKEEEVAIAPAIQQQKEEGTSKLLGYKNIALFGVDSRTGELEKSTLSDTIMIVSINQDTKEVKLVSVYRDTWLNLSNDTYNKANAAYSKGGPKQAISMLNMNLDMDITEYVTIGFDGLIDVIDAVGGIEIDIQQNEIIHLNNYQISMTGRKIDYPGAVEQAYEATEYVDYVPVTKAGLQTLNGTQATAYARVRYVGNDFARTSRQRTVLTQVAKKAMTLDPVRLNAIADAIFPKVSTSLDMAEILSLLVDIGSYQIGEQTGFPFDAPYLQGGHVGKASIVAPVDLYQNVKLLHKFLFNDEDYEPTETVKKCSEKIASDTGFYYREE